MELTKIPLRLPFFKDPYMMQKKQLQKKLKKHNLSTEGTRDELIKRFVDAFKLEIDPLCLDNAQPEKWVYIADLSLDTATILEPDSKKRIECMEIVNSHLTKYLNDKEKLIEIASGVDKIDENQSLLFHILLCFGAALMIAPIITQEAKQILINDKKDPSLIDKSLYTFSLINPHFKKFKTFI